MVMEWFENMISICSFYCDDGYAPGGIFVADPLSKTASELKTETIILAPAISCRIVDQLDALRGVLLSVHTD